MSFIKITHIIYNNFNVYIHDYEMLSGGTITLIYLYT